MLCLNFVLIDVGVELPALEPAVWLCTVVAEEKCGLVEFLLVVSEELMSGDPVVSGIVSLIVFDDCLLTAFGDLTASAAVHSASGLDEVGIGDPDSALVGVGHCAAAIGVLTAACDSGRVVAGNQTPAVVLVILVSAIVLQNVPVHVGIVTISRQRELAVYHI